jgi:uncharacterized Zn finger protein
MSEAQWPALTEATVRELARSKSYQRGQSYYERGAVGNVVRRRDTVRADVEGSQYQPYTVTLDFDDAGVAQTDCSCPYDHGGICKHRVAVLLTCLRDPDRINEKPPLSDVVAEVDEETLQELVVELADNRPELIEWIETRLPTVEDAEESNDEIAGTVNLQSIRKRAEHALPKPGQQGHNDAYAEAERMAAELDDLITQAEQALDDEDGETAVDILEVVTEVLATNRWPDLLPHDATQLYETIATLGETFTEALLIAELDASERDEFAEQLTDWNDKFRRFTARSTLTVAAEAAREGWDDEDLQAALAGNLEASALDTDEPTFVDGHITARLAVLDRQERTAEYLNLAQAAGKSQAYAEMLARTGKPQQAVTTAIESVASQQGLLEIAKTLRDQDHPDAALEVAEHGMSIDGIDRDTVAEWLRDRAASMGGDELALRAAKVAFEESPSMSTFRAVEEIVEDWEQTRSELLATLRDQQPSSSHAAEVFLQEELYDDAIDVAERTRRASVIEPVVAGVKTERPDWTIETCKAQAEPIIEQGKHDSYATAVRWLRQAGEAAQAAGQLEDWREYVEGLRDDHYKKYKLRPMLEELLEEF